MSDRTINCTAIALLLALVFTAGTIGCLCAVVTWALELPNRIEIKVDPAVIGEAYTMLMREALRSDDVAVQLQTLQQLSDGIKQDPQVAEYARVEFLTEIEALANSADEEISTLARATLETITSPAAEDAASNTELEK